MMGHDMDDARVGQSSPTSRDGDGGIICRRVELMCMILDFFMFCFHGVRVSYDVREYLPMLLYSSLGRGI